MLTKLCETFAGIGLSAAVVPQTLLLNLWQAQPSQSPAPLLPTPPPTPQPPPACETFWQRIVCYLDVPFRFGKIEVSILNLIEGIALLIIAIVLSRVIRTLIERRMSGHTRVDPGILYTVQRLVHYFFIAIGVLLFLKTGFSLDLTSVAVIFSALSLGIGFGLQFIAGDIASGFILLFERPVRVGDFITITGPDSKLTEGRVQSINLRTTLVMTNDHIAAIVPNSKLVNQNLINWSYAERRSRISIPIGVAYDSDVDLVTKTLLKAAEGVEFVLDDPKPGVHFVKFGDFSLDFRLLVWTNRPRRHMKIKSDINYRINQLFREANIEIPFPQQDLNLRGGTLHFTPADGGFQLEDHGPDEEEEEAEPSRRS